MLTSTSIMALTRDNLVILNSTNVVAENFDVH